MSSDAVFPAVRAHLQLQHNAAARQWELPDGRKFLTVHQVAICAGPPQLRRLCRMTMRELGLAVPAWLAE